MIASYTTPSVLVQTVRPCKGTWILWSDGVMPWGMKFNTKKNVKLCPSPVGSHNLPICTTYQWCSQKLCVGAGPSTVKLYNSKCSAAQGSRLGGGAAAPTASPLGHTTATYVVTYCPVSKIAKYLGITLTDELSWSSHVHSIHSHANSTLGFGGGNFGAVLPNLKRLRILR